jgi:integrase
MKGHTRRRGKGWAYVVDLGPDPATGKRRQEWKGGFASEKAADQALRERLGQVDRGEGVNRTTQTLAQYLLDEWLPSSRSKVRPSTWASYEDALKGRVIPRIGAVKLTALTPRHVSELYDALLVNGGRDPRRSPGLSARTVRYTGRVLSRTLDDAVKLGLLARNPASAVSKPRPRDVEMTAWTAAEARHFLAHVDSDRLRALWVLYLTGGLRRGEALGLRWADIDLDAGKLAVRRTLVAVGYSVQWSEPKTERSRRVVALDPGTVAELRAHRIAQLEERLKIGPEYRDDDLVFASIDGSPTHPQHVSTMFERHQRDAGLRRIRLHDLRHTAATLLLTEGVPLKIVSERLGHSSVAITADLYQHVTEHMQADAAQRLGAALLGES